MSNKFTGITSAGSAIPVYDKDAHEALSSKLDTTAFSSVSGEFATVDDVVAAVSGKADTSAIPSLDGYATEQWVGEQGYLTEVPEGYATTEDVISATSGLQPSGDYASATDLANYQPVSAMTAFQAAGDYLSGNALDSLSGTWDTVTAKADTSALEAYQTIEGMSAYQPSGDYQPAGSYLSANALDGVSGDWNEVSAKLDTTAFSDVSGSFLTTVPDTYLQNTDLTIVDDKITEISGVPLSAGDELPSGVMNTSALGYNAVNEISGYNGSAIAQYGAEKQWLVHDDTLVHAANSAQYALGCNISALQRLMGIDETVLFNDVSGTLVNTTNTLNLSEPLTAFKRFKIVDVPFKADDVKPYQETTFTNNNSTPRYYLIGTTHAWVDDWQSTSSGSKYEGVCYYSANDTLTTIQTMGSFIRSMSTTGTFSERDTGRIFQIIGIGRKEV